jgi:hypothetical protein
MIVVEVDVEWDEWWLKKRGSFPVFELGGRGLFPPRLPFQGRNSWVSRN